MIPALIGRREEGSGDCSVIERARRKEGKALIEDDGVAAREEGSTVPRSLSVILKTMKNKLINK